jgi:hypothetical protein
LNPVEPHYQRQQPPLLMRCLFGAFLEGLLAPAVMASEKLNRGDRLFRSFHARQLKALQKYDPFRNYTPSRHDVFVAAYVKSGTNWMMQMAHQLVNHAQGEFGHIHEVVPWPDTAAMPPLRKYAPPLQDETAWRASPEQKRVIKTHLVWESLPYSPDARYILVIRDPKDVFVSGYFFFGNALGPARPSVDTWLRLFLSNDFLYGSWAAHNAGYWEQRRRSNVLVLSFKAMKRDLHATVLKVADFLEVRLPEDVIGAVCERCSFDYMKRINHKFEFWPIIPWRSSTPMLRKGVQGGASELLSLEQQRQIDLYFTAELQRLGSDLPYQEFADLTSGLDQATSSQN